MPFVRLAEATEIPPGRLKCARANGHALLIANVDGEFFVTDSTCPHEDASLCTGSLHGEWVKCPLHNSRFNVRTGEVMEEPADEDLQTYPTKLEGDTLFVAFPD